MSIANQQTLDYANAAQQRTAADTGLLEKRTTLSVVAGVGVLDPEVISVSAVFNGNQAMALMPTVEYLRLATGMPFDISDSDATSSRGSFVVVARTLYVWPQMTTTLTLYYTYRPAMMGSESEFELTGNGGRLVDRLAGAYLLFDDGQPELGQAELVAYQTDAKRLARRNRAAQGTGGRLSLAGRRRISS